MRGGHSSFNIIFFRGGFTIWDAEKSFQQGAQQKRGAVFLLNLHYGTQEPGMARLNFFYSH